MEFSEDAKTNATKFLKEFISKEPQAEAAGSCSPPWEALEEYEVEGVCLDLARNSLARSGCPGFLSYHISAEVVQRISQMSHDSLRLTSDDKSDESSPEKPGSDLLSGSLLAKEVFQCIGKVCEDWSSCLPYLTAPRERTELSCFAIKNTRRKMEDRFSMCLDINSLFGLKDMPDQTFFGVYDGHMGTDAAVYAANFLLCNTVHHPAFTDDPATAIREGIKITDERFCKKGVVSGATAIVVLHRGKKLYLGWLGDSQAVVFQRGVPLDLVIPHKPERDDEQERIEAAGGMVLWIGGSWRVNGNLSVSRAIGDARDKKYVIGEADVATHDMKGTEDYVVLACDGVWDVLDSREVYQCIQKHLNSGGSKQTVAKCIVETAKSEGSSDNITVIVVFFSSFELIKDQVLERPSEEETEEYRRLRETVDGSSPAVSNS